MEPETAQNIFDAVRAVPQTHWLLYVSTGAYVWLALIAALALGFAFQELRSNRTQATVGKAGIRQARVGTVLEIVRLWQSSDFAVCRVAVQTLRRDVENYIEHNDASRHLPEERKLNTLREECSRRLYEMRDNDRERYLSVLKLPGFFEPVGMFVEKGYVPVDDIIDLYGSSLLRADDVLGMHLQKRAEEPGMPAGYFKYFRSLAAKARERI